VKQRDPVKAEQSVHSNREAANEPTTTTKTPPVIWTTVMRRASAAQRSSNLQFYITLTRFGLRRKEIGKKSSERSERKFEKKLLFENFKDKICFAVSFIKLQNCPLL
jgi:hypothetical protein